MPDRRRHQHHQPADDRPGLRGGTSPTLFMDKQIYQKDRGTGTVYDEVQPLQILLFSATQRSRNSFGRRQDNPSNFQAEDTKVSGMTHLQLCAKDLL